MLRPATDTDLPFVHEIASRPANARFICDEPDATWQHYMGDSDFALLIWEHAGKPAGFALFCELTNAAERAELRRLALANPGAGLGRPFLGALIDHAFDSLGKQCLWLDVVTDNPRARHLYEQSGFRHEGTLRARWRRPAGDVADLDVLSILRGERTALRQAA